MFKRGLQRTDHQATLELLPWFVNDTLTQAKREQVDVHLRNCLICRRELLEQRRLQKLIRSRSRALMSCGEAFASLQNRLGEQHSGHDEAHPWWNPRLTVAAIAMLCIALIGTWLVRPGERATLSREPSFRTLTNASQRPDVHLKVSFAPDVTRADRNRLMQDIDGRIVSGPGPNDLYDVQLATPPQGAGELAKLLDELRRDRRIHFVGPVYKSGRSP